MWVRGTGVRDRSYILYCIVGFSGYDLVGREGNVNVVAIFLARETTKSSLQNASFRKVQWSIEIGEECVLY